MTDCDLIEDIELRLEAIETELKDLAINRQVVLEEDLIGVESSEAAKILSVYDSSIRELEQERDSLEKELSELQANL